MSSSFLAYTFVILPKSIQRVSIIEYTVHFHLEIWTLVSNSVCYEGKGNQYGIVQFSTPGTISAIKLVHISGLITCNKNNSKFGTSIWTCSNKISQLSTVLTDEKKNIIFPPKVTIYKYVMSVIFDDKDAFEMSPNELLFKRPDLEVNKNTRLHIWNTNDLGGEIMMEGIV